MATSKRTKFLFTREYLVAVATDTDCGRAISSVVSSVVLLSGTQNELRQGKCEYPLLGNNEFGFNVHCT